MRSQTMFEIGWSIAIILAVSVIWITPINLELQYVPTIMNGLASSIGLMVGFTGVLITFTFSQRLLKSEEVTSRISWTLVILALSAFMLFAAYYTLSDSRLHVALKCSLTGLSIAFGIFFDFIIFLNEKL